MTLEPVKFITGYIEVQIPKEVSMLVTTVIKIFYLVLM